MSPANTRTVAFLLVLSIFSIQLFAKKNSPPTNNDDCANATVLTLGTTLSNETVKNMTASTGAPAPCSGNPDDDVWYKFTLSSTTNISVTLSSLGSNLSSSGAI